MVKIGDHFDLNQSTLLYYVCGGRLLPEAGELWVTALCLWLWLVILRAGKFSCQALCNSLWDTVGELFDELF